MIERIWDFFLPKKYSFPRSKDETIKFMIERREKEAKKMWLTYDEYDEFRKLRKEKYLKDLWTNFEIKEIVQILRYENSNWVKNWKLILKNQSGELATAYILEKWSKKPIFWWDFEKYTFAEKFRVRRTAYAYFDWNI